MRHHMTKRSPYHVSRKEPRSCVRFVTGEGWAVKWKGDVLSARYPERKAADDHLTNLYRGFLRGLGEPA